MSKQAPEVAEGDQSTNFKWVSNPNGIPEIYTNYIHASWSLFDVRILLGHLKPALGNGPEFLVEEQGAVSFSWIHAKLISVVLAQLVESYESVNGEIPRIKLAPRYEASENED